MPVQERRDNGEDDSTRLQRLMRFRATHAAATLVIAAILTATLVPGNMPDYGFRTCVLCGERGLSDAILNVILFLPLGATLVAHGWRGYRAVLVGFALSLAIELAQLGIPGRGAALGDVLNNTLGAGIGALILHHRETWRRPGRRVATVLAISHSAFAVLVFGLTGLLLRPSLPQSVYYGQWTPDLGDLSRYRGRVMSASLGLLPIPSRRLADSDSVRSLLLAGAELRVEAVAGPPVESLASLVSIYDQAHREIVLLGPDRGDLVVRFRTLARALRLDQPDLRLAGAMKDLEVGDPLLVSLSGEPGDYCVSLNHTTRCGVGFTLGSGWGILLYPDSAPGWLRLLLRFGWMAGLSFVGVFWPRGRLGTGIQIGVLALGLVLLPAATGLVSTPPLEFAGAGAGALLALALRPPLRAANRRQRLGGAPSVPGDRV